MPNELNHQGEPIPHREWTTGIDRKAMTVKGQMPTVIHGVEKPGSATGYTVAIFNWFMPPIRLGKRFRKVTLEVSFVAHGPRGNAEPEAAQRRRVIRDSGAANSYWDPEVRKVVPAGTSWYHETHHHADVERGVDVELKAGFAPYVTVGPTFHWKKSGAVNATDTIKLTGEALAIGSGVARPNTARWTILENQMDHSGVPAFLRTAVLLRRRERDTGQFFGKVNVSYSISPWSNFKEKAMGTMGRLPKDAPVIFDPSPKYDMASETYDKFKTSLASPQAAAELDKEFHLISFEPKSPHDDGAGGKAQDAAKPEAKKAEAKKPEEKEEADDEDDEDDDSEDGAVSGGVQLGVQL